MKNQSIAERAKRRAEIAAEDDAAAQIAGLLGDVRQEDRADQPFGIDAPWLSHARAEELDRLAVLEVRERNRRRGIDDITKERRQIMRRCIRRMRRYLGKEK